MSLAFPSPEFIPPRPPVPVHRRSNPWHRGTRILFFTLILFAAVLELYPLRDRADVHNFFAETNMELGFPLPYLTSWVKEGPEIDAGALLADIVAVGALVIGLAAWMERWLRRPRGAPWYKLPFSHCVSSPCSNYGGVGLEVYSSLHGYSDAEIRRNYCFDNLWFHHGCENRLQWSGRGMPFTYHRVDPVETPETAGYIAMNIVQETRFYPTILIFDFILVGLAIAEATYWFERRQRGPRILIVEED